MTRKVEVANPDDLVRRYQAGESPKELIAEWGFSTQTFYRFLHARDVPIRGSRMATAPEMIERYRNGESELSIAGAFGVTRSVIRRRLLEAGIEPRNGSSANRLRMARLTPEERRELSQAAHLAVRGMKVSQESLVARAQANQARLQNASAAEFSLTRMLRERGLAVTQQRAIGPYNVDVAVDAPPIAVEIFGGGWHNSAKHLALQHKRVPYILDEGWAIVIIWVDGRRYPLGIEAADYVVALAERLSRHESSGRQYWVIRGDGQPMPSLSEEF